jgi:hypothetical protein
MITLGKDRRYRSQGNEEYKVFGMGMDYAYRFHITNWSVENGQDLAIQELITSQKQAENQ